MSGKVNTLSVKGAKYSRRAGDDTTEKKDRQSEKALMVGKQVDASEINERELVETETKIEKPSKIENISNPLKNDSYISNGDKYWKKSPQHGSEDMVVIHVCDENQHITRDFCCKRNILVRHMKYFEKFLSENENGYDDIDISVHCDVEIFEWLMMYIHEPENPPQFDKAIIVSILISSEFLQMDTLVELCVQHVSTNLNDIIKLPIDLSCISEKLINRIAFNTHPKTLADTKDRKDKILTKLYKRRVELDFSRKGSSMKNTAALQRTIAASLTCCKHCGTVFLENYVSSLNCRSSTPTIDYRGQLASRHSAIPGWSLTNYLKTLHAGGMGWDAIYWHVWAACIVFRVEKIFFSALEVDRYTIENDGLLVHSRSSHDMEASPDGLLTVELKSTLPPKANHSVFVLNDEDESLVQDINYKIMTTGFTDNSNSATTTLNPARPLHILTPDIFSLICSQHKYISGSPYRQILAATVKATIDSARSLDPVKGIDFADLIWEPLPFDRLDRRGRSPGRSNNDARKQAHSFSHSLTKFKASNVSSSQSINHGNSDSDSDTAAKAPIERRSRSSSTGNRLISSKSTVSIQNKKTSKKSFAGSSEKFGYVSPDSYPDPTVLKRISVMKALTPDLLQKCLTSKGPVHSIWIARHPLQIISQAHSESIQQVFDSNLADSKKREWELDILREYDEKRMEKFKKLLVSKRNPLIDEHSKAENRHKIVAGAFKSANGTIRQKFEEESNKVHLPRDYYKDKGRKPYF